ncbi:Yip1 family protein [Actibacterium lipolyticum]|uniref:Yip1 domain protein n=1 Tax=Actibacterium lipolyticum TaxID=1524263 RepID=A0A238JW07_9RHOB|nr:Yip1 family protein [Actibacterium lipolyticum]SMX34830.1 Yip1 domain protein [Actibacterium lipolyticum]
MSETLKSLAIMARDTVRDPKEGARRVLSIPIPRDALWQALALVVILGLVQTYLNGVLMPGPVDPMTSTFRDAPLKGAIIAGLATVAMVIALHRVGRLFGGTGDFDGALRLIVWLQAIMLIFNMIQLFFLVTIPPLAVLMGAVNLGLLLWLLTNFVTVLHGFRSLFPVFIMIMVTAFFLGFFFFFLLSLFGLITLPEIQNV